MVDDETFEMVVEEIWNIAGKPFAVGTVCAGALDLVYSHRLKVKEKTNIFVTTEKLPTMHQPVLDTYPVVKGQKISIGLEWGGKFINAGDHLILVTTFTN